MNLYQAPYCEAVSRRLGCTSAQIAQGLSLVRAALADANWVTYAPIAVTQNNPKFRQWIRIRTKQSSSIRVCVEILGNRQDVVIHAIIPKTESTYDEAAELWCQYRLMHSLYAYAEVKAYWETRRANV